MFDMENIIIILIFGTISLLLISLGIYLKIVTNRFKKDGVKLEFEITDSKTEQQLNEKGEEIGSFYITTIEFTYKGKKQTETLQTRKKIKKGTKIEGIYLPTAKLNKISFANEGYNLNKDIGLSLISIGLSILLLTIVIVLKFSLISLFIFLGYILIIGTMFLFKYLTNKKSK